MASGSDLIDIMSTQASGSRMITMNRLITPWRTMPLRLRLNQLCCGLDFAAVDLTVTASTVMAVSALRSEDAQQEGHDDHHRHRADHADGGRVALAPQTRLEGLVVHEDRPGIGRRGP